MTAELATDLSDAAVTLLFDARNGWLLPEGQNRTAIYQDSTTRDTNGVDRSTGT
jgi:hypothetical protein